MIYLKVALYVIGFILIFSLLVFLLSIYPFKFKGIGHSPDQLGYKYENISFTTKDGILLKGWLLPHEKSKSIVIIGHGYPFDKANIFAATHWLASDFNLLYFDFRYFGESSGSYTTSGAKEKEDALAAIEFAKKHGYKKIGLYGFSMSAAAFLLAESKDVNVIVVDSTYASLDNMIKDQYFIFPWITKLPFVWAEKLYAFLFFGTNTAAVSPANSLSRTNVPVLIIHGDRDTQISVENAYQLYEKSNKSNTELWIIKGADHGQAIHINEKDYKRKVRDFLKQKLE
ncbi:MAG: prolyl oligopeptidase family serine peptidase [Candidatus Woesearchaeota archaeon]